MVNRVSQLSLCLDNQIINILTLFRMDYWIRLKICILKIFWSWFPYAWKLAYLYIDKSLRFHNPFWILCLLFRTVGHYQCRDSAGRYQSPSQALIRGIQKLYPRYCPNQNSFINTPKYELYSLFKNQIQVHRFIFILHYQKGTWLLVHVQ